MAAAALVGAAALALAYAEGQYRFARHPSLRVAEQAEANRRIAGLASNLEMESGALKVQRANLRTALSESNRRLGVCPSIAFQRRGSNNQVARGVRSPDLARLSDE